MSLGLSFSVWKHDGLRLVVVRGLISEGFTYACQCENPFLDLVPEQGNLGRVFPACVRNVAVFRFFFKGQGPRRSNRPWASAAETCKPPCYRLFTVLLRATRITLPWSLLALGGDG